MLKNKKFKSLGLLAVSLLALVGCNDDEIKYPLNYEDPIFDVESTSKTPVVGNDYEHYYKSVSTSSDIYQKTLNQILIDISKVAHNYGGEGQHDVTSILHDNNSKISVADNYDSIATSLTDENLESRSKDSMVSTAKGGSYSKDNLFYENKYVNYLAETYYYLNFDKSTISDSGKLLTPELDYDDIFQKNDNYATYRSKELYDDMRINYLTSEYIYQESYASIGNSNARKIQVIALTDRSDEPGDAKKLLNAYINDYIYGDKKDENFYVLSRLWKGITKTTASTIADGRYGEEIVLTDDEEQWLRDNDILPASSTQDATSSGTLVGKVLSDEKKLKDGQDNINTVDTSLESTYTGSYTYDVETGIRKAVDEIATKNLVTEGIYLSSSGVSSLPSDLSSRIFSTKITTDKDTVNAMKKDADEGNYNIRRDITVYGKDGYRYLTTADTLSGTTDDIIYYDSSSKTYYLTRILDVVDSSALSKTSTTSIYSTDAMKEQIAREVAYVMSTTGSYKTNSIVYWLSRTEINYSDEDFLDYIKSNYKDVFKTDNPYSDLTKIKLN